MHSNSHMKLLCTRAFLFHFNETLPHASVLVLLPPNRQAAELHVCIRSSASIRNCKTGLKTWKSSILISNTGPVLLSHLASKEIHMKESHLNAKQIQMFCFRSIHKLEKIDLSSYNFSYLHNFFHMYFSREEITGLYSRHSTEH